MTPGDLKGPIAGAECDDMSEEEMRLVFGYHIFEQRLGPVSRATRHIRGLGDTEPSHGLEDAVLGVPVLASTDDAETDEDQESETISDGEI